MQTRMEGRRALVTGSTSGIGRAIALALGECGATVVVHGRDEGRAKAVVQEIETKGGRATAVLGRLDEEAAARKVVADALAQVGGIDILINNAGSFERCTWMEGDAARWGQTYAATVLPAVRLAQAFAPGMRAVGWGRIIQIATASALLAPPTFPDYAAAKAALLNLSLSLAKDLAGTGITVNTVSPGATLTPTWERFALQIGVAQGWGSDLAEVKTKLLAGPLANPCARLGRPEDVAAAVAFLASEGAGYINGVNLRVDGGLAATLG